MEKCLLLLVDGLIHGKPKKEFELQGYMHTFPKRQSEVVPTEVSILKEDFKSINDAKNPAGKITCSFVMLFPSRPYSKSQPYEPISQNSFERLKPVLD